MKLTMDFERYLTQHDALLLSRLAENLLRELDINLNMGEELLELLSTSILLPENAQREDCVTLYSEVSYVRSDMQAHQSMIIVCPQDANHSLAHISVLAPLAMALIGRRINSTVEVELPGGHSCKVKVVDIKRLSSSLSGAALEQNL